MLEHAQAHAAEGLKVIPVVGKVPAVKDWPRWATTDPERIRAHWTQHPDHGVGIATGNYGDGHYLAVLDIDGADGEKALAELLTVADIAMPETREAKTPRGRHLYFKTDKPIGNKVRITAGVDVRGVAGFVVAPGTRTDAGEYQWLNKTDKLADWPAWLPMKVRKPKGAAQAPAVVLDAPDAVARAVSFLKSTPPAIEGSGGDARTFATAAAIKDYGLSEAKALELMLEHYNPRCSPPWDPAELAGKVANSFRYGMEPIGARSPAADFKPVQQTAAPQAGQFTPAPRSARFLINTEFKPVLFTVDNLLPEGVFLLVASPKVGKSWLALQFGLAVASGGTVLGERAKVGDVLVLALEDNDRRLKSRLAKLDAGSLPDEAMDRLQFETQWPRVDAGGADLIAQWLKAHPGARLVIVDVLERIRPARDAKANAYGEDYKALQALKAIAEQHRVSVLVVHHTRKAAADDPMQLVSGTQGLAGAADGVLILARARGEPRGELHVMARDLEKEGAFAVDFNDGRWHMVGPAGKIAKTALQQLILDALKQHGKPVSQSQIARDIGRTRQTVNQAIKTMAREGLVQGVDGLYTNTTDTTAIACTDSAVMLSVGAVGSSGSGSLPANSADIFR